MPCLSSVNDIQATEMEKRSPAKNSWVLRTSQKTARQMKIQALTQTLRMSFSILRLNSQHEFWDCFN